MNYLDRQVLSLTADKLIAEFHLTKQNFGEVVAAFRYSYAFVQLFGGWIVDSYGARSIFPSAVGVWSAAGILTAFAPSLAALSACRFFLGAGEAFNWPCALKTTERLLGAADRPLANGLFNSGTAVGAMLAPLVVTICTSRWGWRSSFIATGTLGVAWIFLWLGFTRHFKHYLAGKQSNIHQVISIFLKIGRTKAFWLLAAAAVIVNSISYVLADWIPLYLKTERGFSFNAGNMLSVLVYAGFDIGNLAIGTCLRIAMRHGISPLQVRAAALLACCVLTSCAAPVGFVRERYSALVLITLAAVGVSGFLVIYLTLVQDVDPLHIGIASGMLGGISNFCYALSSPFIGHLSDLRETGIIFVIAGVLPWLAFVSTFSAAQSQEVLHRSV